MSELLETCLADLVDRIDEDREQTNHSAWVDFLEDRCTDDVFIPPLRDPRPPKANWPSVTVNQAVEDPEAMLFQQFAGCSGVLAKGGGARLNVRCNFGTGILASLFGCELFKLDDELNTLPTGVPLGSKDKITSLVDAGVPDIRRGIGGRVFEVAERFLEALGRYPVLGRNIALYHPDVQGPMDAAEVIWGSDMFYAFYDEGDLLKGFLDLITETYIEFMREWYALVGAPGEYATHWSLMYKGVLMIRNDSLMNLSPETYVEFARPLDERLFAKFGECGAMHFCGRGDHYIEAMSEMKGITAVAMSQPHLNDMEVIYRNTVDKGIKLIGFDWKSANSARRDLRGKVQCFPSREHLTFAHLQERIKA